GAVTIERSTISGNTAGGNGGGLYFKAGGSLVITDSTLSANVSDSGAPGTGGGAIAFNGAVGAGGFTLTQTTLSGNSVSKGGSGGAIVFSTLSGTVLIQNSTVTLNAAPTNGGGIARTSGTGTFQLQSTIVAQNNNAATPDFSFNTGTTVQGNSNFVGV